MAPAMMPNVSVAIQSRKSLRSGKSNNASGHESTRTALASTMPVSPSRTTVESDSHDTTSERRNTAPGQGELSATGTTADANSSTEKISQAAHKASARSGPCERKRFTSPSGAVVLDERALGGRSATRAR